MNKGNEKISHFAIRKLTIGAVSVVIGVFSIMGFSTVASASEVNTNNEVKVNNITGTTKEEPTPEQKAELDAYIKKYYNVDFSKEFPNASGFDLLTFSLDGSFLNDMKENSSFNKEKFEKYKQELDSTYNRLKSEEVEIQQLPQYVDKYHNIDLDKEFPDGNLQVIQKLKDTGNKLYDLSKQSKINYQDMKNLIIDASLYYGELKDDKVAQDEITTYLNKYYGKDYKKIYPKANQYNVNEFIGYIQELYDMKHNHTFNIHRFQNIKPVIDKMYNAFESQREKVNKLEEYVRKYTAIDYHKQYPNADEPLIEDMQNTVNRLVETNKEEYFSESMSSDLEKSADQLYEQLEASNKEPAKKASIINAGVYKYYNGWTLKVDSVFAKNFLVYDVYGDKITEFTVDGDKTANTNVFKSNVDLSQYKKLVIIPVSVKGEKGNYVEVTPQSSNYNKSLGTAVGLINSMGLNTVTYKEKSPILADLAEKIVATNLAYQPVTYSNDEIENILKEFFAEIDKLASRENLSKVHNVYFDSLNKDFEISAIFSKKIEILDAQHRRVKVITPDKSSDKYLQSYKFKLNKYGKYYFVYTADNGEKSEEKSFYYKDLDSLKELDSKYKLGQPLVDISDLQQLKSNIDSYKNNVFISQSNFDALVSEYKRRYDEYNKKMGENQIFINWASWDKYSRLTYSGSFNLEKIEVWSTDNKLLLTYKVEFMSAPYIPDSIPINKIKGINDINELILVPYNKNGEKGNPVQIYKDWSRELSKLRNRLSELRSTPLYIDAPNDKKENIDKLLYELDSKIDDDSLVSPDEKKSLIDQINKAYADLGNKEKDTSMAKITGFSGLPSHFIDIYSNNTKQIKVLDSKGKVIDTLDYGNGQNEINFSDTKLVEGEKYTLIPIDFNGKEGEYKNFYYNPQNIYVLRELGDSSGNVKRTYIYAHAEKEYRDKYDVITNFIKSQTLDVTPEFAFLHTPEEINELIKEAKTAYQGLVDHQQKDTNFEFEKKPVVPYTPVVPSGKDNKENSNKQEGTIEKLSGVLHVPAVNGDSNYKIDLVDGNGKKSGQSIKANSNWKVIAKKEIDGKTYYQIGTDKQWIAADYVSNFEPSQSESEIPLTGTVHSKIINNNKDWKIALLDKDGHYTGKYISTNSNWKVFAKKIINGRLMYRLGTDEQWAPADYFEAPSVIMDETKFDGIAYAKVINNNRNWKIALLDGQGRYSGNFINTDSNWKVFAKKTINGRLMYRLGTDKQWVPADYLLIKK